MSGVLLQRLKAYESKWMAGKGMYWSPPILRLFCAKNTRDLRAHYAAARDCRGVDGLYNAEHFEKNTEG
jgi:hypothetical protein